MIELLGQFENGNMVEWKPDEVLEEGTEFMTIGNLRYKKNKDANYAEFMCRV